MKVYWISLILILIFSGCKYDNKSSLSHKDFIFTVEFYPSFMEPCRIILQKKGNIETLSIDNIYGSKQMQSIDEKDLQIEKSENLLIDKWYHQFFGDTIFLKHIENTAVAEIDFKAFQDSIINLDLSKQKSLIKEGILDGITVYFRFKTDSVDNHFSFRCPHPSDKSEFQIIKAVFNIIESSFKTESANNYIEHLKGYFDFGLLVKHISDNPLEYRFYSHLSSNEVDEFYKLMKGLPSDKPIVFDFSNFGGMGTMFYSDFQNLIKRNPNVYWIVNDYSQEQVLEIGVKPERLYKDRQILIKKIKNAP